MKTCRKCNAPISNLKPTVTTPTCPACGAWFPEGFFEVWIIAGIISALLVWAAWRHV